MSEVKRCVQCGLLQEADAFRKYTYSRTNNTEGRYRICRKCEAINTAYRHAKQWESEHPMPSFDDIDTAQKMHEVVVKTEVLYATLEKRGLRVPTVKVSARHDAATLDAIDSIMSFYKEDVLVQPVEMSASEVPDELQHWLDEDSQIWKDNDIAPEYLQETVYESLKAKYRPQIGVDKQSYLPIYDDTYKSVLNKILRRFDDYEEEYCTPNE